MNHLRSEAEIMRSNGYSYSLINEKLGISKSTMSYWFKDKEFTPNKEVLKRIKNGPGKSGILRHNKRVQQIKELEIAGAQELGRLSKRDLWLLGLGIYIGEGSKTIENVRISNSDPTVIAIAMRWLKEICELDNSNITIRIHIYPDNNINESIQYWSKVTGLPQVNFRKTYIDQRDSKKAKKRATLPYGTAHLSVVCNGNPKNGVALYRKINGWMTGALNQL